MVVLFFVDLSTKFYFAQPLPPTALSNIIFKLTTRLDEKETLHICRPFAGRHISLIANQQPQGRKMLQYPMERKRD